ncbi:unnamed protein product [Colias eurytheme]|nr:unnamed protein product [Colias eurytheme]
MQDFKDWLQPVENDSMKAYFDKDSQVDSDGSVLWIHCFSAGQPYICPMLSTSRQPTPPPLLVPAEDLYFDSLQLTADSPTVRQTRRR